MTSNINDGGPAPCLDDYEVLKAVGKGKFAVVYRARRIIDDQIVALKRVNVDSMDERARNKCLKEVRLLSSLDHPNIIQYMGSFLCEDSLIIIIEWAGAGDMKRQIRKAQEKHQIFHERTIWKYFLQICLAIQHMHQKRIMHRDLKPANIFLTVDGMIKVGDFGLSRELSDDTLLAHSKVGTPLYMAPEVLRGDGYDFKSDIWSLGCLLYEFAMLKSPFKAEGLSISTLFQKISTCDYPPITTNYSSELHHAVIEMLNVLPDQRIDIDHICELAIKMKTITSKRNLGTNSEMNTTTTSSSDSNDIKTINHNHTTNTTTTTTTIETNQHTVKKPLVTTAVNNDDNNNNNSSKQKTQHNDHDKMNHIDMKVSTTMSNNTGIPTNNVPIMNGSTKSLNNPPNKSTSNPMINSSQHIQTSARNHSLSTNNTNDMNSIPDPPKSNTNVDMGNEDNRENMDIQLPSISSHSTGISQTSPPRHPDKTHKNHLQNSTGSSHALLAAVCTNNDHSSSTNATSAKNMMNNLYHSQEQEPDGENGDNSRHQLIYCHEEEQEEEEVYYSRPVSVVTTNSNYIHEDDHQDHVNGSHISHTSITNQVHPPIHVPYDKLQPIHIPIIQFNSAMMTNGTYTTTTMNSSRLNANNNIPLSSTPNVLLTPALSALNSRRSSRSSTPMTPNRPKLKPITNTTTSTSTPISTTMNPSSVHTAETPQLIRKPSNKSISTSMSTSRAVTPPIYPINYPHTTSTNTNTNTTTNMSMNMNTNMRKLPSLNSLKSIPTTTTTSSSNNSNNNGSTVLMNQEFQLPVLLKRSGSVNKLVDHLSQKPHVYIDNGGSEKDPLNRTMTLKPP